MSWTRPKCQNKDRRLQTKIKTKTRRRLETKIETMFFVIEAATHRNYLLNDIT